MIESARKSARVDARKHWNISRNFNAKEGGSFQNRFVPLLWHTSERGNAEIGKNATKQLKEILLSIARADAREALSWAQSKECQNGELPLMSDDLSRAISSIKIKSASGTLDAELKLYDKLKAIELYFKLEEAEATEASDGTLYINYDYKSAKGSDE